MDNFCIHQFRVKPSNNKKAMSSVLYKFNFTQVSKNNENLFCI